MERIRVGIIGCGNIAVAHLNGYRNCANFAQVVALSDLNTTNAKKLREEFTLEADVYGDYHKMLKSKGVDVVDICLPIIAHSDAAIASAKAGKHILIEKPFANTLSEAKQIVKATDEARVTLMVAHDQRFRAQHLKMKQFIESGKIGRIVSARADINQNIEAILPQGHWHYSHRGALISIGIHMLDLLRYFVGNVKRISGFHTTAMMPMIGQKGVEGEEADDLGVAAFEFDNGALGTLVASYCAKAHPWHDSVILHGTAGGMHTIGGLHIKSEVDDSFAKLSKIETENEDVDDWRFRPSYSKEIEHFLKCLREGKEPLCSGHDNLYTMGAIEAIYKSSVSGKAVDVNALVEK